jgi:hypothetical protein
MEVVIAGITNQTASLMFALDPHKGRIWKQRIHRMVLGLGATTVGCFALAPVLLNSANIGSQHQGAALSLLGILFVMVFIIGHMTFVKREQKALQLKMGQRGAEQLATDLKIAKLVLIAFPVLLGPMLVFAVVPRLRGMAGNFFLFFLVPFAFTPFVLAGAIRAKRLRRQMAATSASLQIVPINVGPAAGDQNSIASTIKKVSGRQHRQSRQPRPKITVRESGVTLRFLEQFYAENEIPESASANDVVSKHVKPHTNDIEGQGSGPFVELIQTGETNGVKWCGVPTHMVSYSWKYTLATMLDVLRKFELDRPATAATPYRYYIDQFALDQHGFGDDLGSEKEVQAMMLETLNESIAVPGKMLCMLHPW